MDINNTVFKQINYFYKQQVNRCSGISIIALNLKTLKMLLWMTSSSPIILVMSFEMSSKHRENDKRPTKYKQASKHTTKCKHGNLKIPN